ncbi:Hypothetical predicted protein [Cloeon dipterum]|uniref:Argininosuccinate synthase n=1 Tax=Cloeon dipterum TaxID=197152 RepID=A0A8S1CWP9_9INSE|nr:Hypothetical predicted protein [Cloeon dipterum]
MPANSVILAYSGGLDTSCILAWLVEKGFQVTAYLADIGQEEDYVAVRKNALLLGAKEIVIDDLKSEFVCEFAWPGVACGLRYEGRYLLGTSLARPVICKGLVRAALERNIGHFAHGATGKGNDQVRFELGCAALAPHLKAIVPWRDAEFTRRFKGRQDLIAYAKAKGFPVPATPAAPYSTDANLLHISYESGMLEDPAVSAPKGIFNMTTDPEDAPDVAQDIEIGFEKGLPTSVKVLPDGAEVSKSPVELFTILNAVAGKHGVGRIDIVENRFIGLKSRGVYESPGMTVLFLAHLDLETFCLDREVLKAMRGLKDSMTDFVYNGFWFSPECNYVRDCLLRGQNDVNGKVKVRLFKGSVSVLSRKDSGSGSLYNQALVSMDEEGGFTPSDSTGFINCHALRLREYARYRSNLK